MISIFSKKDKNKDKFDAAFSRSRNGFKEGFLGLFGRKIKIDSDFLDEIEAFLYQSDLGPTVTEMLVNKIEDESRKQNIDSYDQIRDIILNEFSTIFKENEQIMKIDSNKPAIVIVIGVNGAGKTTSIGKLANYYRKEGKKVLIIAGDTYRAAAVEQLDKWAQRSSVDIVKDTEAKNPSGLIFDGIQQGIAKDYDIIIIDTAGRLHTKTNLMEELSKIYKVIQKLIPEAPHESLLVLDGTVGQNGLVQAEMFKQAVPVTGLIITKLDGTAKGGIIVGVKNKLNIPVKFVGLGEKIDDLVPFNPEYYVNALFRS